LSNPYPLCSHQPSPYRACLRPVRSTCSTCSALLGTDKVEGWLARTGSWSRVRRGSGQGEGGLAGRCGAKALALTGQGVWRRLTVPSIKIHWPPGASLFALPVLFPPERTAGAGKRPRSGAERRPSQTRTCVASEGSTPLRPENTAPSEWMRGSHQQQPCKPCKPRD